MIMLFLCSGAHRVLHSFPTRRSSDLDTRWGKPIAAAKAALPAAPPAPWRFGARGEEGGASLGITPPQGTELQQRSEEHTSELQSLRHLVCRLLLEKKKKRHEKNTTQS